MRIKHSLTFGLQITFAALTLVVASSASGQSWPTAKPITFINPFPPGGAVDGFGRPLAQQLGTQLGTTIIVDNRGGAGGTIGAALASKMAPDGYTWFLGAVHHAIAPSIYPKLSYSLEKDFEPVALISDVPHVIVVNPRKVPEKDLQSLLERLKKTPGKVDYASTGSGTSQHLAGELFKLKTGAKITHVPYRGTGPALQDLVAGHVDMMFDTLAGSSAFIKSGQLKPLAVTTKERVAGFESVPTATEAGVPDYVVSSWYALFAIKGTPKPMIDRMIVEVEKALAQQDMKTKWTTMGATSRKLTGAEFGTFVHSETLRWADVVKKANIRLD
ncbi:tripartite tricarboxylate transporter substrate binding protein [Lacisediminimonas sp.]|uniref:Bug family tripartite tricarboxylate transporter substrate binding protein n=1 Tax=Lacisediminimonas sp. TaxID=3060582 RepID=UPI00271F8CD0|nr:tripartite tricarboxylate transporter substrate binding protein [Lacisediminimonas sp.]MDO8300902.1 tripartite tricarboxylate transporter substrate binding protein [Lacisediminimonas sp.]MDO9217834.1 tripartite tricarboxylate transporter substrate binding protein [Lacisediminimonas sp.]